MGVLPLFFIATFDNGSIGQEGGVLVFSNVALGAVLFAIDKVLKRNRKKYPKYAARLKERNLIAQIKTMDDTAGRWFKFKDGKNYFR